MFGEEDFINQRNYTTSVRCSTHNAIVLMINSEEFLKQFKKDSISWDIILKNIRIKDEHTIEKIGYIATRNYLETK
jgi:hypothetical protein